VRGSLDAAQAVRHARSLARAALLAGLALLACGCGYSTGMRVAGAHRSVGVAFFGNETFERDVERQLADEVTLALRNWSDAPLVDPRKAETVVEGTILAYHRRSGIRNTQNEPLETGLFIEVEAWLAKPGIPGRPKTGTVKASTWVGYIVGPAENEREARDRALRHIAEELVLDLFVPPA